MSPRALTLVQAALSYAVVSVARSLTALSIVREAVRI